MRTPSATKAGTKGTTRKQPAFEAVKVGSVTVKIYRRVTGGRYERFEVADYSGGRRVLRGFADRDRALAEADRIARLMAAGEVHAAQFRGTDASSYGRALELLRPTGTALEVAAGRYAEAFQALGSDRIMEAVRFFVTRNPDKLTSRTVAEVAAELISVREKRGASSRYERYRKHASDASAQGGGVRRQVRDRL